MVCGVALFTFWVVIIRFVSVIIRLVSGRINDFVGRRAPPAASFPPLAFTDRLMAQWAQIDGLVVQLAARQPQVALPRR